jgi:hypothetical protein
MKKHRDFIVLITSIVVWLLLAFLFFPIFRSIWREVGELFAYNSFMRSIMVSVVGLSIGASLSLIAYIVGYLVWRKLG